MSANASGGSFGDFMADYLPYLDGKPWPEFKLIKYVKNEKGVWVHPSDPDKYPTLKEIHGDDYADFATVVLCLPDGSTFKTYNALVLGPYLAEVYSGDFNNDGLPDFVAIKPGSGNGLAAEYCTGVFAFSGNSYYRFARITTMGLGPASLVAHPTTKEFRLIHTSFRQSNSIDNKIHSYFVHRFFKWEYGTFRPDSSLPPIWIQYLFRPNHDATKLLTPRQKEKAWNEDDEYLLNFPIDW